MRVPYTLNELKQTITLWRDGDFYYAWGNQATMAATVCPNAPLTKCNQTGTPIFAVPYFSVDDYANKMSAAGHRVVRREE